MIKPLSYINTNQIVSLHVSCFPMDTLTLLGRKFLRTMYRGLLSLPDIHAYGYFRKSELLGFVVGVENSHTSMRRVIIPNILPVLLSLLHILLKPGLLKRVIETFFYGRKSTLGPPAELLVIGVSTFYRKKGIGKKLFTAFNKSLNQKNLTAFHVSVYADNKTANSFYKNLGARKSASFFLYGKKWHIYEHHAAYQKSKNVTIVLPTYNEVENIVPLVRRILIVCPNSNIQPEIIVVDDNSPDGTAEKVRRVFQNNTLVRVIVRIKNRGLAPSISDGLQSAKGPLVVVMDTDFNHSPETIPHLISALSVSDVAIGSRFVNAGGMEDRLRYYLSYIFNQFIRLYLQLPTQDNLSGFFAVRKSDIKPYLTSAIFSGFGEYFIRVVYRLHNEHKKFKEVPVYYLLRHHGQRKSQFLQMFLTYFQTVIKLKK